MRFKKCIIEGFGQYLIYEDGRVYSLVYEKFINQYNNGIGHIACKLKNYETKVRKQFYIHRLVAIHFIENDNNLSDVNHIDGNKENNNYLNLEWLSRKQNMQHAFDNKLLKGFVEKHY